MGVREIIAENKRRLKEINAPYNPITGEGSISIERKKVYIKDSLIKTMYLPVDFANTNFVKLLSKIGFRGYITEILKTNATKKVYSELWDEFNRERINYDFEFWCISLATISEKGGGRDIPFLLNRAQRIYLKELEKLRLSGIPIDIILVKARQWGGSTLTQLYMLWIQLVHKHNWNSVICGRDKGQSSVVAGMLSKVIRNYKKWATGGMFLKTSPFERAVNTRLIEYSNCIYSIGSYENPEAIRSQDVSMAHLTEVGTWNDTKGKKPEDLIQSIFGSMLSGPYTMKVLESTAKGVGNYFHRTWTEAVNHKNNFTPVFIPWYIIDIYSLKISNYCHFISSMNEYENWMFKEGATLEAIAWYRKKHTEITDDWRMKSEFPTTSQEAFQSTGNRVFPIQYVENVRNTCIDPIFKGEFVGKKERGKEAFENLHFEERENNDNDNILLIWVGPDSSIKYRDRYVVSVDIGGVSIKSDPSEIKVADRLPMMESGGVPEIVAEWHGHIEHDLLIWKAAQISKAYGNALLVIESNTLETERTEGDNFEYILDEIKNYYDNLYYRTKPEQIKEGLPITYGFHTNVHTKPIVIDFIKSAMRDLLYLERSMPTTYEYDLFERKENGIEMGAVEGNHDDRVMATAILIYVCYKWPMPYKMSSNVVHTPRIISEASI